MNQARVERNKWLLIPFYSNPDLPIYSNAVSKFKDFVTNAKNLTGLNLAIVDDGSRLKPGDFMDFTDRLVQLPENSGKALALKHGLKALLEDSDIDLEFIVQYDGDGDQSYVDIPHFITKLQEVTKGDPTKPALLIGDRYSEKLVTPPNLDSIMYRQSLLIFFGSLAGQLGFDIKDWVSGARGYTKEYAKRFLERSRSSNYGVEAEQLVVAYLEGASVHRVPLAFSRPRDPHTLRSKWLQNFDSFLLYKDELEARGQHNLIDVVVKLTTNLRNGIDEFDLDLAPLGTETTMRFRKQGTTYTAEIPSEYRAKMFNGEGHFTLRKEAY